MKSDLSEMTAISRKLRDDRDWEKFHSPKDLAMDLSVEASEVLEHFLWVSKEEIQMFSKEKKKEVADELSDVMNPLLLLADALNINLLESFKDKMKRNAKKYPVEKVKGRHAKYNKLV
jgi:NTP pyrophosphatase (non-canonical NTP hydrolase)